MHLVQFQLLQRQAYNTTLYNQALNKLPTRTMNSTGQMVSVPDTLNNKFPVLTPQMVNGPIFPPAPNEMGWKDTIQCPPGQVTSILVPYGYVPAIDTTYPSGAVSGVPFGQNVYNKTGPYGTLWPNGAYTGNYVTHCHILDHEENDTMQFFNVV